MSLKAHYWLTLIAQFVIWALMGHVTFTQWSTGRSTFSRWFCAAGFAYSLAYGGYMAVKCWPYGDDDR
jgi:hypothetical protein